MIVELFGPYATGKTTLTNEALSNGVGERASEMKFPGDKQGASGSHPFFKKSIDFFLGDDFVNGYFCIINNSFMSASQKLACVNMFYASAKRYALCMQTSKKIILEDEGLLLRGLDSTSCSYDVYRSINKYYTDVPLPDVIVFCSSGIQKEKERILSRGFGINPFYSVPDEYVLEEVERVHARFRLAKEVLSDRKDAKFFCLDLNVDSVDTFSRKLHDLIR